MHVDQEVKNLAANLAKIDHPLVLRQLVINHAIEQTILIREMREARVVMRRERLPKVKQCFSIQDADPDVGMRFAYGTGSNLQSSFIDRFQGATRMKTQKRDQIR